MASESRDLEYSARVREERKSPFPSPTVNHPMTDAAQKALLKLVGISMRRKTLVLGSVILVGIMMTMTAYSGEIGHFVPGVVNIRDLVVPPAGFYGVIYNYGYSTSRLNDANGNKRSSVTIGGHPFDIGVDVNAYALAPTFIWSAKKKVIGAQYAAYVSPTFSNSSINGLISSATGAGRSASTGQFNIGDILVEPVWLGWSGKHYHVSYGYGFYIPSGKYKTTTVTLPAVGSVTAEAVDNIGLGFWTHQNQGALYLYPWKDQRMAVQNSLTWEIHGNKRKFDLTPGQNLTWNWGVSQYLPLKKDSLLLEVGPAGYSSFQVSDDSGMDAKNPGLHDRLHAAGLQVGVTSVKWVMSMNFHWFHEFSSVDRFQGNAMGLNFTFKF
jgi:hypothetical protein